ncbi:MAG: glycerol-3-phosphate 1-O-acyltransferase PlsY [Candidatus Omnitrophota bacterium]
MLWILFGITISYLIGSIPTAYIFGRVFKGMDIRQLGSGNVGATNVLRTFGKKAALFVLTLDMLKGATCVIFVAEALAPRISSLDLLTLRLIMGISSICGHNWTLFLKFKGGKGVATTFGVMLALAFRVSPLRYIFIILVLTWLVVFLGTRIVSLASVISACLLPICMGIFKQPPVLILFATVIAISILLRHKSNLKRLFQGKEHRIHFKS